MLVTNQSFSPVLRWVHHISLKCCASLPRAPEMRGIFSALLPKISTIAIGVQIKSRFFNDNLLQWNGFQMSHSCSHLEYVPRLSKVNPVGKERVSQKIVPVHNFTYLVCGDSIMTRAGRETLDTDGAKYGASVSSSKRESGTRLATS